MERLVRNYTQRLIFTYCEFLAVYMDDLIIVSNGPLELVKELKPLGGCTLKGVGKPEYCLGGDITRTKGPRGQKKPRLSAKTYIKNICDKIEQTFNNKLRNQHSLLESGYRP